MSYFPSYMDYYYYIMSCFAFHVSRYYYYCYYYYCF